MLLLITCSAFVNWLATTVLVEAEGFRPLREWIGGTTTSTVPSAATGAPLVQVHHRRPKLAYLGGCHLCTGTWVGLAMALFVPGPFTHVVAFLPAAVVLNGLTYKAGGHAILHVSNLLERLAR